MTPANVTLTAWRNARFAEEYRFAGPTSDGQAPIDFTGWTGELEVRLYGAQPGDAIISLSNVASDIEGVWIIEPSAGAIQVSIERETLADAFTALGGPAEAGSNITLVYDLILTTPTGDPEIWMQGAFIFNPGVTI